MREGQLSHPSPPRHHFFLNKSFGENPHPGTCCIFHAAEGATGQAAEETQRRDERKQLLHSLFSPHFHPHPRSFPTQKFPPSAPLQAPRAILLAPPRGDPGSGSPQQSPFVGHAPLLPLPPEDGADAGREGEGGEAVDVLLAVGGHLLGQRERNSLREKLLLTPAPSTLVLKLNVLVLLARPGAQAACGTSRFRGL